MAIPIPVAESRRDGFLPVVLGVPGMAVIVWLQVSIMALIKVLRDPSSIRFAADDALRLVQVRDLLGGQRWFDLTQYRMTPPHGVPMHWSRLIDAPIAGLDLFFRLVTNPTMAEILAMTVWPLLLFLPVLLAMGYIAQRLADRLAGLGVLLLAQLCIYARGFFVPGEIDHHNAQLALTLVMTALLLDLEISLKAAVACAAVIAISLGIGLETLPYALTACLIVAGLWVWRGKEVERSVRGFGLALAGVSAFLLFSFVADYERFSNHCDTFSGLYALLAVTGGLGLAAASWMPALSQSPARRALSVSMIAVALVTTVLTLAPQCTHGPYYLFSSEVDRILLSRIDEVKPPFAIAFTKPELFFATYVYALAGLGMSVTAVFLVERRNRTAAVILTAILCATFAILSYQLRGAPFALLAGLPGIAVTIRLMSQRWFKLGTLQIMSLIAGLALFTDIAFALFGKYAIEGPDHVRSRTNMADAAGACIGKPATSQLAHLPRGEVATLAFAGPAVLAYTQDSVMAAQYSRDGNAILDSYHLFTDTPDASAAIAHRYGIDYVMTCRFDADYAFNIKEGGSGGLIASLDRGRIPTWLKALPPSGQRREVHVYKVLRDRLSYDIEKGSDP